MTPTTTEEVQVLTPIPCMHSDRAWVCPCGGRVYPRTQDGRQECPFCRATLQFPERR